MNNGLRQNGGKIEFYHNRIKNTMIDFFLFFCLFIYFCFVVDEIGWLVALEGQKPTIAQY